MFSLGISVFKFVFILQIFNVRLAVSYNSENPCSKVFRYERFAEDIREGWYGVVKFPWLENYSLSDLRVNIVLDRVVGNLETRQGKVTTADGAEFLLTNLVLENATKNEDEVTDVNIHFHVKLRKNSLSTPKLKDIKVNGDSICNFTRRTRKVVDEDCGVVRTQARLLITNATSVKITQYPWHAAIYRYEGSALAYKCGGSLITKQHILTAAHCAVDALSLPLKNANASVFIIYLGLENRRKLRANSVQDFDVSEVRYHRGFNLTTFHNDIAVLTLEREVTVTDHVRPVCLWEKDNGLSGVVNRTGYVAGWGYDETYKLTDELKHAPLPVIDQAECIRSNPHFFGHFSSTSNYCAGARLGTSVCNGDSGGSMVFLKARNVRKTVWEQRGVVSLAALKLGTDVCDVKEYVLFTDVVPFMPWIKELTGVSPNKRYTTCGRIDEDPRSVNTKSGNVTQRRDFPWQGDFYVGNDKRAVANLVSARHAVTVAFADLKNKLPTEVHLYCIFRSYIFDVDDQQVKEVDRFAVHPNYNGDNENRILVMRFTTPIEYTNYVRPVCLWQEHADLYPLIDKKGRVPMDDSDINHKRDYTVLATDRCLRSSGISQEHITPSTFCAGAGQIYRGICDLSHGRGIVFPIANTDPSVWQLRGMLTNSLVYPNRGCYLSNFVFVDVARFLDWIEEFMDE